MANKITGFTKVPCRVILDEDMKAYDIAVFTTFCSFADNETRRCHPSIDAIIERSGASERTVRRSIRNLMDKKYINVYPRFGDHG